MDNFFRLFSGSVPKCCCPPGSRASLGHGGLSPRGKSPQRSLLTRGTATIVRPIEEHLLFPQESTALRLQSTIVMVESNGIVLLPNIRAEEIHGKRSVFP